MINIDELNQSIEMCMGQGLSFIAPSEINNPRDEYIVNSARRVIRTKDLLNKSKKYLDDFYISLRNYLISTESSLKIDLSNTEKNEEYNLFIENGRVSAFQLFPKYVNSDFVKTAYLSDYHFDVSKNEKNNLCTDPFIKSITGYVSFKSMSQKLAVYSALNTPEGYTTLISMPTGGGKSLVTQTVAYQNPGLTIVIVPTVSLSIDQERVSKHAIKNVDVDKQIFSYSSGVDATPIIRAIKNKEAKLLFISPEALMLNDSFINAIEEANRSKYLKNIIVDEAHIVTDWGALFRVDYQCLESWRKNLTFTNKKIRTFLLSATFEKDCVGTLKDLFSEDERWIEVRCDELRKEPRYCLVKPHSFIDKQKKLIEMAKKLPHPMIIYVASPDEAEDMKAYFEINGISNIYTFTGKTNSGKRKELIDKWINNEFEIMIATSAFGVGVNKSDVRTVIHAYVPQNANAYYQELGRGGRDGLPCLSVMCVRANEDGNSSFQKVAKRVMTSEKICKRWNALYNDHRSIRNGSTVIIDTSISPGYLSEDENEFGNDHYISDSNMNWNIYVILSLRRNKLISIKSVVLDDGIYKIQIDDISKLLSDSSTDEMISEIEKYREKEYKQHIGGFELLRKSITSDSKKCWSEMFYETYNYVDEYCGGCANHSKPEGYNGNNFPLKLSISSPVNDRNKLSQLFGNNDDVVIKINNDNELDSSLCELINKGINLLVCEKSIIEIGCHTNESNHHLMVINRESLTKLLMKDNGFYVSGVIGIIYPNEAEQMKQYVKTIIGKRIKMNKAKLVHIIKEDIYIESSGKLFSDMINGPIVTCNTLK